MDGRRQRGERTRRTVATKAAELASVEGLSGMSFGQLAKAVDLPKSSVQVAFRTKQDLQLATIVAAHEVFAEAVVQPAGAAEKGLPRLLAIIDHWVDYIAELVLPGGCFMGATFAESDSKPGAVRDALADMRGQWIGLLEYNCAVAQASKTIPQDLPPASIAFEIDALLAAANVARNLHGDTEALETARNVIHHRLQVGPANE